MTTNDRYEHQMSVCAELNTGWPGDLNDSRQQAVKGAWDSTPEGVEPARFPAAGAGLQNAASHSSTQTRRAPMTWDDVLADPLLRNAPGRIELDDAGQVVMTPLLRGRAMLAPIAMCELAQLYANVGHGLGSLPVQCVGSHRVMVTDAAWASQEWLDASPEEGAVKVAPEHCVQIMSPSNTRVQMTERASRYLQAGAVVVWIIDPSGVKTVHGRP